jgi:CheY-like chemotaxis protein
MISALQKAYPRLAALLGARGNGSDAGPEQPNSAPQGEKAATARANSQRDGTAHGPGLSADHEAQRTLNQFFEVAPERVAEIRALFPQVSAAPAGPGRNAVLAKLYSQVRVLRSICDAPGLESVSKLTKALEQLLNKISDQSSSLTPSLLRTTASSIVLLETLCKPGLRGDLVSNPLPRFLSIDDDPICRQAISSALEQAFSPPDHAENGEAAITLVERRSYDIIFLDIEMPGMDGFEVCKQIHMTAMNPFTPVVFVTIHSDFESRAKASESSGQDLIAKPFLPCELTLKALTVLLRRRMQEPPPPVSPAKK